MNYKVYEAINKALQELGLTNEGGGDDGNGGIYTEYTADTPDLYSVKITIKN